MGLGQRERVRETNTTIKVSSWYMIPLEYLHICTKQSDNRRNKFYKRLLEMRVQEDGQNIKKQAFLTLTGGQTTCLHLIHSLGYEFFWTICTLSEHIYI